VRAFLNIEYMELTPHFGLKAASSMAKPNSSLAKTRRKSRPSALVLINRRSGTVRTRGAEEVAELVRQQLSPAFEPLTVELCDGDIMPAVQKALASHSHDVIIAGGGDGTIASVAGALKGSDIVMGALPLGTMNLFVQALGFSAQLEQALAELVGARQGMVDVGEANGRVFLHQISFGLQPRMARLRERIGYSSRFTKLWATARALLMLAARPKIVRVILQADGPPRRVKTPVLVVSNNPLGAPTNERLPVSLQDGVLGLYVLEHFSLPKLLHLALDYLANRVTANPAVTAETVSHVTIRKRRSRFEHKRRRRSLQAAMDGEMVLMESPVRIRIRPISLRVLMPEPKAVVV
jgi:diacylglycerol kinase family enzyme